MTQRAARRLFRTVLFTDIVGSTALAAELGDRKWRRTVAAHHAAVRGEIKRHHGREIDTAGDGFFAIFESPTDAVRCAAAAVAATHSLGLRIRAGVHTGEVEPTGASYGGIAVHIGARLLATGGPGAGAGFEHGARVGRPGSGHEFDDFGVHELKGVPGEWHVYSLVLPRFEEGVRSSASMTKSCGRRRTAPAPRGRRAAGRHRGAGRRPRRGVPDRQSAGRAGPWAEHPGHIRSVRHSAKPRHPRRSGPGRRGRWRRRYWTANVDAGTVSRIDIASGAVTSLGQAGAEAKRRGVDDRRAWIVDRYTSRITILDRQGTLLDSLPMHASAIAASDSQVWLVDDIADRAVRLDPLSAHQVVTVSLPTPGWGYGR